MNELARIGDNLPPQGPLLETPEQILERLNDAHADIRARVDELAAAEARMPAVADDATETALTDYARQLRDCASWVSHLHEVEKAPFLAAGRVVDGWKNTLVDILKPIQARLKQKNDAWVNEKDRRARARLREEAARLEAEARERHAGDDASGALAAQAEAFALKSEAKHATAADLTRRHTGTGVLSAKTTVGHQITNKREALCSLWDYIDDEALDKAARAWIRAHDRNSALKEQLIAHPRTQQLLGVRLFIERKANVR